MPAKLNLTISIITPAWRQHIKDARIMTRRAAAATLRLAGYAMPAAGAEIGVVFADDVTIRKLNKDFRHQDKATNVLSFPGGPAPEATMPAPLGDVILAWETVHREALEQDKPIHHHTLHLIVHGILHLLGYDHEQDAAADHMEGLEIDILKEFGVSNPYHIHQSAQNPRS